MKKLELLNNVERAKLLFDLFPGEIPSYVHYTKSIADTICNDPDYVKHAWEYQIITLEFWLQLAEETKKTIGRYNDRLTRNTRLLSDQLFDGYRALFSVHCLHHIQLAKTAAMNPSNSPQKCFTGSHIPE